MKYSIFIFRRDLRLDDNVGLIKALKESEKVIPIFIFTPEQLVNNKYKSDNAVQFMMESLEDLEKQLKDKDGKLYYYYGHPHDVIEKILKSNKDIEAVYVNKDYTPYSKKRDAMIKKVCAERNAVFKQFEDVVLNPIGSIKTTGGEIYTKFTPYFRKAKKIKVDKPQDNRMRKYFKGKINGIKEFSGKREKFYKKNDELWVRGGRKNGLKILKNIEEFKDYNKTRNMLDEDTTYLSAYNKFGCVSIREVYHRIRDKLGMKNDLIKQLYWRDFYYNIMWKYPRVLKTNMKEKYDKIKWKKNKKWWKAWRKGETGFPVVDAGMRQLNKTGFMHNRTRLIVSNFLIKLMLIDWHDGEHYFERELVDVDLSQNNGNWGWSAGSGADSQPYFRIFNPWTQGEKFDPEGIYIKTWVPELRKVDSKDIHKWYKVCEDEKYKDIKYPAPILDYKKQRKEGLRLYKKYL